MQHFKQNVWISTFPLRIVSWLRQDMFILYRKFVYQIQQNFYLILNCFLSIFKKMFEYDLRVLHVCPVYLTLHLHRNPDDPRSVHWPCRHGRSEHVISINQILYIYIVCLWFCKYVECRSIFHLLDFTNVP